jgi:carboxypeptidase T
MRYLFTFIIIGIISFNSHSQEVYSKVRISLFEISLGEITKLGIDVTEGTYVEGRFFETDIKRSKINRLTESGITYTIVHEDVSQYYETRAASDEQNYIIRDKLNGWTVPSNWEYGLMGGFYTLEDVLSELDDMHALYPNLISQRVTISDDNLTHEGRSQYWVRISDNASVNEGEPEILYTGAHHACEPIGVQQIIYYMWYLLENYTTDIEIKHLVDNTEMYFIPVVNPDGYEYNHQTNPNGGGMWRKNRRDNGGGIFGVDPNRNYGYKWGVDNQGSSPYPDEDTYRGPSAFSEPEIQNIRDFCESNEFDMALNYHSYGNLLLYSWGWTEEPCVDNELMNEMSLLMTGKNDYTYGPGSTTIYPTNGASDDWMYGEQMSKDVVYSFTPEVGTQSDGHWPTISRIIPLCKEQMWQNISAARLVGKYATLSDNSPFFMGEPDGYLKFKIKRIGLTDTDEFTVSIQPMDNGLAFVGDPVIFENLSLLETHIDSIEYMVSDNLDFGETFRFLLEVDNGEFAITDTIEKMYGNLISVFEDSGDNMGNWTSSKWNNTTGYFYSNPASITDSPDGKYQNSENNIVALDSIIDLSMAEIAFAKFWVKWEIESDFDYVQFMVKEIGGGEWEALSGLHTQPGSPNQPEGEPVYDGESDWVLEEIDLSDYIGKKVQFRFVLISDQHIKKDGYYFDDFIICIGSEITGKQDIPYTQNNLILHDAFPNPAHAKVSFRYHIGNKNEEVVLEIINILGEEMISQFLDNSNNIEIVDVINIPPGIYFYRISTNTENSKVKRFIKH